MRSRLSDMRMTWPKVEARAEPIWTMGPSRPTEPPVPMQMAEAKAFTPVTGGRIFPPFSATAKMTSGTRVPEPFGQALDQRPIEQATDDGNEQKEPDPEPRKMGARNGPLLAEIAPNPWPTR